MKTSVMEVRDMLSVLSVLGVEKRIGEVPGVESVTVNFAAGSATVRFDETRLSLADIRSDVRQSGSKDDVSADGDKQAEVPDASVEGKKAEGNKPVAAEPPPAAASAPPPDQAAVDAKPSTGDATHAADETPSGKR